MFDARNVLADHGRYINNVIKNLPADVLSKVVFLLQLLPPNNKYKTLKRALIEKFSIKEETKIENFLNNTLMGTLTPSEFLENSALPNSISLLLDSEFNENNEHIFLCVKLIKFLKN